jgi:hypothetical protein
MLVTWTFYLSEYAYNIHKVIPLRTLELMKMKNFPQIIMIVCNLFPHINAYE